MSNTTTKNKKLTEQEKETYVESSYCKCPYCSSYSVVGGFIEIDGNTAVQEIRCGVCGKAWRDIYRLVDIEESE